MLPKRVQLLVTPFGYKQVCSHEQAGAGQATKQVFTAHEG